MTIDSPRLLSRLDRLVAIPSVSSVDPALDMSNQTIVEHLAEQFSALGFDCELVPCPAPGKFNLIATLGSGPGGLVLAGHTDTVPFDEDLWTVDPFRLTEQDHRLFGLGVTDMKGFFPMVMEAAEPFLEAKLREPLIVLATADEESSMHGARCLAELGRPRARSALIGEPTGLRPVHTHKGMMMDSIHLLGQSGHSSNPALGRNALDAMHAVISDLMAWREELREEYRSDLYEVPWPTLNLGSIHGGDNPNRICGSCELKFDIRLVPGMNIEELRAAIKRRVARITEPLDLEFELKPLFTGVPAFFAGENSALLQTAEQLTGHNGISVAFGTEAPFLQGLGMDTIIMGPGSIEQAHQPDEYLSTAMIKPCIEVLRQLIAGHCLEAADGKAATDDSGQPTLP